MRLNLIADVKFNYDKAKSVIQFESTPPQPERCGGTAACRCSIKKRWILHAILSKVYSMQVFDDFCGMGWQGFDTFKISWYHFMKSWLVLLVVVICSIASVNLSSYNFNDL